MRLPTIEGVIRRRILVNFRADPQIIQNILPPRFRPKLHQGRAIAGICLIRLEHIRPKALPQIIGISSENAAHRIAVLWDEDGLTQEGVFIPRRDTNSQLNSLLGGRVFPGEHHKADFKVNDNHGRITFSMKSVDGDVAVNLVGKISEELPQTSVFRSLSEASSFFETGSLGYSVTADVNRLDGLRLHTKEWRVEPLAVEQVYSSYFEDEAKFPRGSAEFDHALIMRNIAHEWHTASDLHV
ncbi:MAG TPA: DUF2071 domain-containing protein [Blastocatellia bacterium]|jgi:uncharacterized protein YqjF (DUF2071 family)|nr:DUF2071 domain-containing protein [Blastocatellia bacterium]